MGLTVNPAEANPLRVARVERLGIGGERRVKGRRRRGEALSALSDERSGQVRGEASRRRELLAHALIELGALEQ